MTFAGSPLSRSLLGVKRTWGSAPHMSAFDPKRTSPLALYMLTSDIQAAVHPVLAMRLLVASFTFLPAESFGWPLWLGADQLVARVAAHRRVAAHDRCALGVARDCLDV